MKRVFKRPAFPSLLCVSLLWISASPCVAHAQRAYYEFETTTDLWDAVTFSVAPSLRYDGDFHHTDALVDLGLNYERFDHFQLGFSYRRGREWDKDDAQYDYERFAWDIEYTSSLWERIDAGLRIRYTTGYDPEDEITRNSLRYRLKLAPDKRFWGIKPYLGYELFQDADTGLHERNVLFAGLKYKLRKNLDLSLEYKQVDKLHSKRDFDAIIFSCGFDF